MARDIAPQNRLLALLGEAVADLEPLSPVQLAVRAPLLESGVPALHVYFPITAVISLVSTMETGASAEVALVGREGMVGLSDVLGPAETQTSAAVRISGTAVPVATAILRTARRANTVIGRVFDLYTEAHLIQVAQIAACNRLHSLEQRLARWLLAIHDRVEGDAFVVAQEVIADMLGVRRPTVSIALKRLQEQRAIERRGRTIVIADRRVLEGLTCECHHVLRDTFDRVFSRGAGSTTMSSARPGLRSRVAEGQTAAGLEAMRDIAGRLLLANIKEQEARETAEAANRAKDQFLAMVSHELRTPLNAILGWCAILHTGQEHALERGLPIIERNAHAQLKIVEDLLDAARITSATLTIEPATISLPDLVCSAVEAMKPAADQKAVALDVSTGDAAVPPLCADAGRLRQVILNVLTNSLKFTDTGGSIHVHVSARPDGARVVVRDTGKGIPAAVLPHVFDRFQQGSSAGVSRQGVGLGLTIARAIIELHGGTIAIESPGENQGTTCTIDLPLGASTKNRPTIESRARPAS